MSPTVPEGFEALSKGPRARAEEIVDRALRTTHHAIRFTAAVAEALGPRGWEDEWVRPGGDRRLYARDPERPGWFVAQPLIELSLDVAPPERSGEEVSARPRPQPEGPDQRSGELRLIFGERNAQWSYDEGGVIRERCRGMGASPDDALPFLRDIRQRGPDAQRPHPLFLRDDLEDGLSPEGLAARFAALDHASFSDVRVWMPVPLPGGPALAARRAVWELRRAAWEGRWSYPTAGWVILDGYVADVTATGATFASAFASWQDAVKLYNPVPRDSRTTPAEAAKAKREFEKAVEEMEKRGEGAMHVAFRFVPPREMPFPPRRPECVPAVAIRVPEPPALPPAWRAAGFGEVVPALDEEGRFGHGFVAREADGSTWYVGEQVASSLDPATLRRVIRAVDAAAARRDREIWEQLSVPMRRTGWQTSHFQVQADGGLTRTGWSGGGKPSGGVEPAAALTVAWTRPIT